MNFDQAFEQLISHEGGYVNHPNDPGGETKFGITKRSYPKLNIKTLTLDKAKSIYYQDFWLKAGCDHLQAPLNFQVFDAAVNSGVGNASRFLQRALGIPDDGVIGPVTIDAINCAEPQALSVRFNVERLEFMTRLSTWRTFGRGWARRIASNLRGIYGN